MNLLVTTLLMMYVSHIKGDNIMLGKPSKQSSTYNDNSDYDSTRANDGSISTVSWTRSEQSPYWQGDLQGYYRILNITVTRGSSLYIRGAYIGVSVLDVSNPDSDVHKCGQWPDMFSDSSDSLTYMCSFQQPVRFVRIWREDAYYHLAIAEVIVEAPSEQVPRAWNYVAEMSKKLTTARKSVTVDLSTECATLCYEDQNCHAFSFRKGGQLNCLLGIPGNLDSDSDWRTYILKDCYNPTTCPGVNGTRN